MSLVLYFVFALAFLAALSAMILKISRSLGDCPQTGRVARAAGVTITTGYTAIGSGAVALIGSALPVVQGGAPATLFAIGFAALVLGLGFTHAITSLRDVVVSAQPRSEACRLINPAQIATPVAAV